MKLFSQPGRFIFTFIDFGHIFYRKKSSFITASILWICCGYSWSSSITDAEVLPAAIVNQDGCGQLYNNQVHIGPDEEFSVTRAYMTQEEFDNPPEGIRLVKKRNGEFCVNGISTIKPPASNHWRPICPEGAFCSHIVDQQKPVEPLNGQGEIWLQYDTRFSSDSMVSRLFRLQVSKLELIPSTAKVAATTLNSIKLTDGHVLVFSDRTVGHYSTNGKYLGSEDIPALKQSDQSSMLLTSNPVLFKGEVFIAINDSKKGVSLCHRNAQDNQWTCKSVSLPATTQIARLSTNPTVTGLWAVLSEISGKPALSMLWESLDQGLNWHQVDKQGFSNVRQIVLDTVDTNKTFAITHKGSVLESRDQGVSWFESNFYMITPTIPPPPIPGTVVSGLITIPQAFNGKLLVIATETGIFASRNDGGSWYSMNQGLPAIPYTLSYTGSSLIASGATGYFVCPHLDCFGEPLLKAVGTDASEQTIAAIEFYNSTLDHYFLTSNPAEAMGIEEGKAGPDWQRTGHSFKVWPKLGAPTAAHVCRFYGSVNPGPNSHFFSISPAECSQLLALQDNTPEGKPRWHLEDYPFMAVPKQANGTCPNPYRPVYRAYNNGFSQGKDSNHRFVTDRTILEPLFAKGWADEGIAFCVPE